MAGSTARYASAEPAKSLVSATPTAFEMPLKTEPKTLFWLRKKPFGSAIRPGEKALAVMPPPPPPHRRAASAMKSMLQSLLSLYALSGSKAPPSTIVKRAPPSRPLSSPRLAHFSGPPCLPPPLVGSCTPDAVTSSRGLSELLASDGRSSDASAKWPRWLVPTVSSKPSAVNCSSGSPTLRLSPALSTSVSSGAPCWDAAKARTDARLERSHAAPRAMPPARRPE